MSNCFLACAVSGLCECWVEERSLDAPVSNVIMTVMMRHMMYRHISKQLLVWTRASAGLERGQSFRQGGRLRIDRTWPHDLFALVPSALSRASPHLSHDNCGAFSRHAAVSWSPRVCVCVLWGCACMSLCVFHSFYWKAKSVRRFSPIAERMWLNDACMSSMCLSCYCAAVNRTKKKRFRWYSLSQACTHKLYSCICFLVQ